VPNSLDLYSRVEDLLGVNEASVMLYEYYFATLESLEFNSLLDVGCGRGAFLEQVKNKFPSTSIFGIDLSPLMVKKTKDRGINAESIDICEVDGKFQVVTAVFDMINYLDDNQLTKFMRCVEDRLESGGYFICDINSLYAFEVVAVGSFIKDDNERFTTVDSFFEDGEYYSEFTLFEKVGDCFKKRKESITQYYHTVERLQNVTDLELIDKKFISIYSDEVEKFYLVFRKK
jgi:SAM-dependent methyltransferase